jgi:hypothetical protein
MFTQPKVCPNAECGATAKIRNDLSRMARKTWVTTKKAEMLQAHLDLYIAWNNGYKIFHSKSGAV